MDRTMQPECPKCKSYKYKIINGPRISKSKWGTDIWTYLLQCQDCHEQYKWDCPVGWQLAVKI